MISASGVSRRLRLDWLAFAPYRRRVHVDPPVERAAAAAGGDPAVFLHRLRRGAPVRDLRDEVHLALAVRKEQPVEPAGRAFALERDAQGGAQDLAAEREQVLCIAASRREPDDAGLDLGRLGPVLVQPHMGDIGALSRARPRRRGCRAPRHRPAS